MKLSLSILLSTRPQSACRKALKNFFSSSPISHASHDLLYRRISPVGDPDISVVPVLNQWVREGRSVEKEYLQRVIKELQVYKRFRHALEISQWMTDRRYIPPSRGDTATRLYLIYEVHGLEKAEEYYNNITKQLKGFEVYIALLKCYAHEKSVEKAEDSMQKIRDTGHATTALPYNVLMNLYYHIGSWEKLDLLMCEMEKKGIRGDKYTFTTRLSAYGAASDSDGIDTIMTRMQSDPQIVMDCHTYILAANAYSKVGSVDRVWEILKTLEGQMSNSKRKYKTFNFVLRMYAEIGKKDELFRLWNLYEKEKIFNKGYMNMISSLLKFDDIKGAEKIFEEWESRGLSYDFQIPDFLINAYVKSGHLGKAEVLRDRGIAKGGNPSFNTWYYLTSGYIEDDQVLKAVESLKKVISAICSAYKNPIKDRLVTCLEYLEKQRDLEGLEEFIQLLKVEGIFSATGCERLLGFIKSGKSKS